jgi:uncharacterized protein (DUF362 family)
MSGWKYGQGRVCASSTGSFPEGIHVPEYFFGKNIVHLPTTKCHIYTTTTGAMKNAFGGLPEHAPALHAFVDSRDAGRPAAHPEGNPLGLFAIMDGTTAGNGPGTADDASRW